MHQLIKFECWILHLLRIKIQFIIRSGEHAVSAKCTETPYRASLPITGSSVRILGARALAFSNCGGGAGGGGRAWWRTPNDLSTILAWCSEIAIFIFSIAECKHFLPRFSLFRQTYILLFLYKCERVNVAQRIHNKTPNGMTKFCDFISVCCVRVGVVAVVVLQEQSIAAYLTTHIELQCEWL